MSGGSPRRGFGEWGPWGVISVSLDLEGLLPAEIGVVSDGCNDARDASASSSAGSGTVRKMPHMGARYGGPSDAGRERSALVSSGSVRRLATGGPDSKVLRDQRQSEPSRQTDNACARPA
jgi:hypothetical protein